MLRYTHSSLVLYDIWLWCTHTKKTYKFILKKLPWIYHSSVRRTIKFNHWGFDTIQVYGVNVLFCTNALTYCSGPGGLSYTSFPSSFGVRQSEMGTSFSEYTKKEIIKNKATGLNFKTSLAEILSSDLILFLWKIINK